MHFYYLYLLYRRALIYRLYILFFQNLKEMYTGVSLGVDQYLIFILLFPSFNYYYN